jgi:hypothetical protein
VGRLREAPVTDAGRLIRRTLDGAGTLDNVGVGVEADDEDEDEQPGKIFFLTLSLLARRRFSDSGDGRDVTAFVTRVAALGTKVLPRRETEAVIWVAFGDFALRDAIEEDIFTDIALEIAWLLIQDMRLSATELDAIVGLAEEQIQWALEHLDEIPPPPEQGRMADWAEWRRQMVRVQTPFEHWTVDGQ